MYFSNFKAANKHKLTFIHTYNFKSYITENFNNEGRMANKDRHCAEIDHMHTRKA